LPKEEEVEVEEGAPDLHRTWMEEQLEVGWQRAVVDAPLAASVQSADSTVQ
jgi:hypothetical protein